MDKQVLNQNSIITPIVSSETWWKVIILTHLYVSYNIMLMLNTSESKINFCILKRRIRTEAYSHQEPSMRAGDDRAETLHLKI